MCILRIQQFVFTHPTLRKYETFSQPPNAFKQGRRSRTASSSSCIYSQRSFLYCKRQVIIAFFNWWSSDEVKSTSGCSVGMGGPPPGGGGGGQAAAIAFRRSCEARSKSCSATSKNVMNQMNAQYSNVQTTESTRAVFVAVICEQIAWSRMLHNNLQPLPSWKTNWKNWQCINKLQNLIAREMNLLTRRFHRTIKKTSYLNNWKTFENATYFKSGTVLQC